jgi:hypothetical protein
MSVVVTQDRYEHTFDLVVRRNFALEYHVTKVDRFFFDTESRVFCDAELHLVGWIISFLKFHSIREREFHEGLVDEIFQCFERFSGSDEFDDHKII